MWIGIQKRKNYWYLVPGTARYMHVFYYRTIPDKRRQGLGERLTWVRITVPGYLEPGIMTPSHLNMYRSYGRPEVLNDTGVLCKSSPMTC